MSDGSLPERVLLGAVLAGGEARRFGAPKAEAVLGGRTLVQRAVDALRGVVREVIVVSSRAVPGTGVPVVPDRREGLGPLGGLETALLEARARECSGVLLLACDLPLMDEALLRALVEAAGDSAAAAPERIDAIDSRGGGVEPTCAVYGVEILDVVQHRLESGVRSLHALFRDVPGALVVPLERLGEGAEERFLNVNTVEDAEQAKQVIRRMGDR